MSGEINADRHYLSVNLWFIHMVAVHNNGNQDEKFIVKEVIAYNIK